MVKVVGLAADVGRLDAYNARDSLVWSTRRDVCPCGELGGARDGAAERAGRHRSTLLRDRLAQPCSDLGSDPLDEFIRVRHWGTLKSLEQTVRG